MVIVMKTVLNVKTDSEVKEKAQSLAKHLGIPLSTVVNAYLKEFVTSGSFSVQREPELTPAVKKELVLASADAARKESLSPVFKDAKTAIAWLNS